MYRCGIVSGWASKLMSVATIGAFAIGELPEAVAVMLLYAIGEALQDKAVDKRPQ